VRETLPSLTLLALTGFLLVSKQSLGTRRRQNPPELVNFLPSAFVYKMSALETPNIKVRISACGGCNRGVRSLRHANVSGKRTPMKKEEAVENNMHPIYKQYPMMTPYVGDRYKSGGAQSLLLIGESHYLRCDSTQHLIPVTWYSGHASTLDSEEQFWINPSEIIRKSSTEGFRIKAHSIYRKSFFEINQHGPKYEDYRQVGELVVFYNYFLRPARKGKSLQVTEQDARVAGEVFNSIFGNYRPSAIVFLSKLAHHWYSCSNLQVSIPIVATPHPGCRYWNRVTLKYGNKRGRDILGEFIKTMNWENG
jgi:hypothetical protein